MPWAAVDGFDRIMFRSTRGVQDRIAAAGFDDKEVAAYLSSFLVAAAAVAGSIRCSNCWFWILSLRKPVFETLSTMHLARA